MPSCSVCFYLMLIGFVLIATGLVLGIRAMIRLDEAVNRKLYKISGDILIFGGFVSAFAVVMSLYLRFFVLR